MGIDGDMRIGAPFVSVVLPVYNDPEGVRMTVESVADQTYPMEAYEVIVVDNNSDDNQIRRVIEDLCREFPETVRVTTEVIQGQSPALNKGIERSHGSLIAFIDADMTVERTWLADIVETIATRDIDYMGCSVELYTEDGEESPISKYELAFSFPMGRYIDESNFSGSGCLVVTRDLIDTVGPFDATLDFSFDREFGRRVHDAGFEQHFAENISMYHPARSRLSQLVEKSIRTGRGKHHLHTRFPEQFDTRGFLDPRKYLPPHPLRFYNRLTERTTPSRNEIISIFAVAYLAKLMRAVGEAREYVSTECRFADLTN
jgi:glycosyltransferase involved in cell wall biosynthesis